MVLNLGLYIKVPQIADYKYESHARVSTKKKSRDAAHKMSLRLNFRFSKSTTWSTPPHTHVDTLLLLRLIWLAPHCCFLFLGRKPITSAEMKGLGRAPSKACSNGPVTACCGDSTNIRPGFLEPSQTEERKEGGPLVASQGGLMGGVLVLEQKKRSPRGFAHAQNSPSVTGQGFTNPDDR